MSLVFLTKKVIGRMTLLLYITVIRSPQRAKPMRKTWYQIYSYLAKLVLDVILGHRFLNSVTVFCISISEARNNVPFIVPRELNAFV